MIAPKVGLETRFQDAAGDEWGISFFRYGHNPQCVEIDIFIGDKHKTVKVGSAQIRDLAQTILEEFAQD